ncbi:uncharacterized protein [Elaeis guineensis]|uniref:Uncharacterized protein LOC105057612 n=1 Tax=Elaeis guineensis var. tenera TaxID=51953 RepID=A0A6I9S6V2_ELAGV|nr:uncharacterized protein LOC105057612 [Elaeis guineensis]
MGNGLSPCFSSTSNSLVKLVFWGGTTKFLAGNQVAGELMFRFPDSVVCHADSFYIGQPVPVLSIGDELIAGETYFVMPVDRFPCNQTLTAVTLASLSPGPNKPSLASVGQCPFEYVKGSDGRTLIKVQPEFITKVITANVEGRQKCGSDGETLCSTPELKKHYAQLVGSRDRPWSPKLETISESKSRSSPGRLSPVRLLGGWKRDQGRIASSL